MAAEYRNGARRRLRDVRLVYDDRSRAKAPVMAKTSPSSESEPVNNVRRDTSTITLLDRNRAGARPLEGARRWRAKERKLNVWCELHATRHGVGLEYGAYSDEALEARLLPRQQPLARVLRALRDLRCRSAVHRVPELQRGPRESRRTRGLARRVRNKRRVLGGADRELGERVPPGGGVRHTHRLPDPEGLVGVEGPR